MTASALEAERLGAADDAAVVARRAARGRGSLPLSRGASASGRAGTPRRLADVHTHPLWSRGSPGRHTWPTTIDPSPFVSNAWPTMPSGPVNSVCCVPTQRAPCQKPVVMLLEAHDDLPVARNPVRPAGPAGNGAPQVHHAGRLLPAEGAGDAAAVPRQAHHDLAVGARLDRGAESRGRTAGHWGRSIPGAASPCRPARCRPAAPCWHRGLRPRSCRRCGSWTAPGFRR